MMWLVVACSCAPVTPLAIVPSDGAIDVPRDAQIFVHEMNGFAEASATVRLHDPDGVELPVAIEVHTHWLVARPLGLLPANTVIDVRVQQYLRDAVVEQFTTGDTVLGTAVAFAGVTSWRAETMQLTMSNTCYSETYTREFVEYPAVPSDTVLVSYRLYRERDRALVNDMAFGTDAHLIDNTFGCDGIYSEGVVFGERYCAAVTAYDIAGHATGGDVEACGEVTPCRTNAIDGIPAPTCDPFADDSFEEPTTDMSSGGCTAGGDTNAFALLAIALSWRHASRRRRDPDRRSLRR